MSSNLTWKDELVNDELQRLENQFTNFNLNHSNLCLLSFNNIKTNVSSTSKMKVYNEEQNNNNDRRYSKKEDSKKSSDIPFELPDNYVHDKRESRSSLKRDPNVNSSTLSLHIAAYEKFVDGEDLRDLIPDKLPKQKNTISIDPFIKLAVFEFPRQQNDNDKVPDPEISQYKASQKLLNPKGITTEVSVNCKILNEIFKTQPGIRRCEWRKQILIASGCSRYIPSQNILWSISPIEKETIAKCKKLLSAAYDTVSVVIGDRSEWEKIFLTETSKNDAQPVVVETADEKLKRLEKELENAQDEKAKTDEECLKLKDIVKQKEDRIDELELRYSVEQKRNLEKLAKIDKLEAKTATVSEEMVQKDKKLCELMGNLKIKDKEIIKLAETNVTVVQQKDEQICELMAEIKLKDETINELTETNTSLNNKLEKVRALNQSKNKKLNSKGVKVLSTSRKRAKETDAPIEQKRPKYQVMENAKEYSFAFMILCVQLSWLGIFDTKIVEAIRLITLFFNITISRIPDRRTIGRWCNDFSLFIDAQLDTFLDGAGDWTLHSDETTLNSDKLQAYIICKVVNGVRQYFVVGIEQVPDKSAARSLKAFIACLKRTIKPFENLDDDTVQDILIERLGKIKNVVGDRASTQKKFNNDLWMLIVSLIPGSPKLNQIFCNHHVLASVWDVFVKSCLNDERIKFDCPSLNFSTLQNAIQFVSSTYGERSNKPEKVKELNNWAEKKGYKYVKFPSKLGSRWNVGPAICASLFNNKKIMLQFLTETKYIDEPSHSALVKVLKCPAFVVVLQIGAWLDQIINGPWWTEMDSDKHVIELNINSAKIIHFLEQVAEDPNLCKNDDLFPLVTERSPKQIVFRDTVMAEISDLFLETLPQFCQDLVAYLKKQLEALLEDAFINDEDNREVLASASVSNKVSEQIFGMTTDKRHLSSSLSNGRIAASVAGVKNKTIEFIENLNPSQFENLRISFKAAKSRHRRVKLEEKTRLKQELTEHYENNQEKQRKKMKRGEKEFDYDILIGQTFVEKWETEEYKGIITKKQCDGYEVYYPAEQQYDLLSRDELVDLIATQKIIFDE